MIQSGSPGDPSMKNFLSRNSHFKTKRFTELVTKHLMKFQKEIDGYFLSLGKNEFAYIKNPFNSNSQMLLNGKSKQEELVKLQHDGFARDVYAEKNL